MHHKKEEKDFALIGATFAPCLACGRPEICMQIS